ncbi:MAG: redox-sensing transcriptional repressor Rex, partial [Chloroflexota bacterium]
VGDLGRAVANYRGFPDRGFTITCAFDSDPGKIGKKLGDIDIQSTDNMQAVLKERDIQIAMLAVPAHAAQAATDQIVGYGIKAILNYAPINLNVPDDVRVQYIDPVVHMQRMTFYLP